MAKKKKKKAVMKMSKTYFEYVIPGWETRKYAPLTACRPCEMYTERVSVTVTSAPIKKASK